MLARALLVLAPLALVLPRAALAYQCTPVPGASPPLTQAWQNRCIPFWINNNSDLMANSDMRLIVDQSFSTWSENNCTDLSFDYFGYTDQKAGFDPERCDNKNIVAAVEDEDELNMFFDSPDLLAVTLTSFSRATGEIFDADILFNTVNPDFNFEEVMTGGNDCQRKTPPPYDIRNTLVHEMGHFIGFDHVNEPNATMFPSAVQCEVNKRSLAQDDIDAVCETYPTSLPTQTCAPPDTYDKGGDPTPFRNQCASAQQALCDDGGNTCSCRTTARPANAGWFGLVMVLVLGRRRLSGR